MEFIIASRPLDYNARQHVCLVTWEGYSHNENMWKTYEKVLECSSELLKEYYGKNPTIERDGHYGKKR